MNRSARRPHKGCGVVGILLGGGVALGFYLSGPTLAQAQNPSGQAPPEEDIRPPQEVVVIPREGKSNLSRNLLLLAILTGAGVGVWWWMRRFRPTPADPLTPLDQARATLGQLNADREVLTAGDLAERTANVVRYFIAGQYGIAAPQRTTEEFLRSLTTGGPTPLQPHVELLEGFLVTCDRAKFAGTEFDPVERYALIETAGRFVQAASYTAPPAPSSPP